MLGRAHLASLLCLVAAGCGGGNASRADNCRVGNALGRIGRQNNPVANAVEDARCDQLEAQERADAREARRDKSERDQRNAESKAQNEARLAEIRRAPRVPEVGATAAEAMAVCEQEHGTFTQKGDAFACRVGGPSIFVGLFDSDGRISRLDVYYEGGDLVAGRQRIEASLGPHEGEMVLPDGFRAFTWKAGRVALAMYPQGLRMSMSREPMAGSGQSKPSD